MERAIGQTSFHQNPQRAFSMGKICLHSKS